MGEQVLHKITIAGVDVTNYMTNYTVIDTVEDITPAKIVFIQDIISKIDLEDQQEVIITRGMTTSTDYTIFRGYVASVNKNYGTSIIVECFDKLWILKRKIVSTSYDKNIDSQAGVVSAIAQDLIETHGGLTADVEASGSINTSDKVILRNNSVYEKLKELAKFLDYDLYYDPSTDKVNFKTRGFTTFGTTIQTGVNLAELPTWEYDYSTIINDVTIIGGLQEVETTDTSNTGNGVTTAYTLDNTPESIKVFVNSVLKTGGISSQTASFDYSIDKETNIVTFETAPPNTQSIEFRYSYLIPVKVRQRNDVSINKYGTYAYEKKIDTIVTNDDAVSKSTEIMTKFDDPLVKSSLRVVNVMGMQAGYEISVVDTIQDENRTVKIRRITYNYPVSIDELDIDDAPLYTDYFLKDEIVRRLRDLEKRNQTTNTLITQVINKKRDFKPRRRYMKLQKDVVDLANSWIVGHPIGSIVGTNLVGGTYTSQDVVQKLVQGNMTYEEYAYDTDFHDSINSTATFSTVTNDITFTSGQVWYSGAIDIGTTLSSIRVDLGTVVGTLKIEISSNGKTTWQTVNEASLIGVTTSDGTGTYIRITENAATTATIDLTQDSLGQNTEPVIKVLMVE